MKQTTSKGLRKVLYMAIAMVLVIAVSVSVTLAYLTDSTAERDNVFKGQSNEIQGSIREPSFNAESTHYYSPGGTTPKDPMVQNDSIDDAIFTGVKLTFFIKATDSGSYVQVPYDVFDDYVTVKYNTTAGFNTTNWADKTNDWKVDSNDMAKYFAYNTALAKTDGTNATATYSGNGADTTAPLFTSVTMSPYIHIPETVDNSKKVANTSDGIAAAGANLNANDQYTQDFESCDFKIRVVGWGVKAAAAGDAFSTASTDDVNNIKTGLQGLA